MGLGGKTALEQETLRHGPPLAAVDPTRQGAESDIRERGSPGQQTMVLEDEGGSLPTARDGSGGRLEKIPEQA